MIHIYALVSGQLVLYVGRTYRLAYREYCHRKKYNSSHSRYIPEHIDWTIKLLETVPDDQAIVKEQSYYDTLNPLYNRQRPGQTKQEYENSDINTTRRRKYQATIAYKERKKIADRLRYLDKKQKK
jgi:hypothetical protein